MLFFVAFPNGFPPFLRPTVLDFFDDGERLDHFDLAAAEALAKSSLRAALQVPGVGSGVARVSAGKDYGYPAKGETHGGFMGVLPPKWMAYEKVDY